MNKFWIIITVFLLAVTTGCNKVRRNPGRVYMPDMAYSRAYETYASTEELKKKGINYTAMPVAGTIARGDMLQIYTLPNDSSGYNRSTSVPNPLKADSIDMKEAERLYLVNCAICHGTKLDGEGPLWKGGAGPYPVAPKNLMGDDIKKLGEGAYFHVMTYGKGQMGSYASQLDAVQRWMVASYIKKKQGGGAAQDTTAKAPVKDTAAANTR